MAASPSASHLRHRRTPKLTAAPFSTTPDELPVEEVEKNTFDFEFKARPPSPLPIVLQPSRGSPFNTLQEWVSWGSKSFGDGSAQSRMSKVKTGILKTSHDMFRSQPPSRTSSLMEESEHSWSPGKMARSYSFDSSSTLNSYQLGPAKFARHSIHDSTSYPLSARTASRARKCLSAHAQSLADSGATFSQSDPNV